MTGMNSLPVYTQDMSRLRNELSLGVPGLHEKNHYVNCTESWVKAETPCYAEFG